MKYRHSFTIILIVISALCLFLSLQYLNQYTSEKFRGQIEDKLSALSFIAKKRVLAVIERVRDSSALISSRTQMRISLDEWNKTHNPSAREKINKIILDAESSMTRLFDIRIYDEKGALVSSTDRYSDKKAVLTLPQNHSFPIIQLSKGDNQLFISSLDHLLLNGRTIGYVEARFYADFVIDMIRQRAGLGQTGEWLFAIRHKSGDALMVVPLKYDQDAAFTLRIPKKRLDVPMTQALLGNEIVMRHAPDYIEQPVVASTRYIPELDWGLVVKMNESEVKQLVNGSTAVIYTFEAIIIGLAILVGGIAALYLLSPVVKGKQSAEAASGSTEEVSNLAGNFNEMVSSIKELNNNLNAQIGARSKELDVVNQQLRDMNISDPKTGLSTYRSLSEKLAEELQKSKRYNTQLALVILDVDHLTTINETFGYHVGDQVLKGIANYLQDYVREEDSIARISGEEFCLLLPGREVKEVKAFIDALREGVNSLEFQKGEHTFNVTCSYGIAYVSESEPDKNIEERASIALRLAKENGRNRIEEYRTMPF